MYIYIYIDTRSLFMHACKKYGRYSNHGSLIHNKGLFKNNLFSLN